MNSEAVDIMRIVYYIHRPALMKLIEHFYIYMHIGCVIGQQAIDR